MTKITIKKGFFWSAGTKYGWTNDDYQTRGVGIEKSILQNNKKIIVEILGQEYTLDCDKAREFINKYKASQVMSGGTTVGIVSASLLEKIDPIDFGTDDETNNPANPAFGI